MQRCVLVRQSTGDQGTFGVIESPSGKRFFTIELPWRENKRRLSCIPAGRYTCIWHPSKKFGVVPLITGVPGRDAILMHRGNFAGDVTLGYSSDYLGCIGVGLGVAQRASAGRTQKMIVSSAVACERLFSELRPEHFELLITEKFNA